MDNIINAQTSAKTFLKKVFMITTIVLVLSITMSTAYAVPPYPGGGDCEETGDLAGAATFVCCWTETDSNDPEQIEINKCQECWVDNGVVDCAPPFPDPNAPPTTEENIVPEIEGGIEQPPTESNPPIRSDNSIFPNENSKVLDESQPSTNPTFNSNKGTVIDKNLAQDQPMLFSSNDEQSQESEELTEENNPNTESNSQENDDSSTSESTTSLSKRGNTQNSPVPPECPKQGPIPPNCTMKPKF
jgi:hypothetical protein